jgi:hypothetical protein
VPVVAAEHTAADEEQGLLAAERDTARDEDEIEVGGTDVGGAEVIFSPNRPKADVAAVLPPLKDEQQGHIARIVSTFTVFLPRPGAGGKGSKTDWTMTWLGAALFGYLLSTVCSSSPLFHAQELTNMSTQGIFQIKYLYAEHVFGWGAEQVRVWFCY